jgi:hypothetical protein
MANDQYSKQEAQQRFEKLVKVAQNTRPKPIKRMDPKGVPAQSRIRPKSKVRKTVVRQARADRSFLHF